MYILMLYAELCPSNKVPSKITQFMFNYVLLGFLNNEFYCLMKDSWVFMLDTPDQLGMLFQEFPFKRVPILVKSALTNLTKMPTEN